MRWRLPLLLVVLAILTSLGLVPPEAAQPAPKGGDEKKSTLTVPEGFVVEKVAGQPLVNYPMLACFDEKGRLFVAENAGVNFGGAELVKNPPSKILLLEDTDGDGKFDKSSVFADRITFPTGVLWHRGALYACAPPSVWKFEDTDGDGKADKRTEMVTRFGFVGNGADLHGPFLHPGGRLYWTNGRHGHNITLPDGKVLRGGAACIYRCKLDGGDIEIVCGGGMENLVEVVFTPEGEPLSTVTIFQPSPRIDVIVHGIEGGAFPWHEAYREFKSTGPVLPPVADLGWVAPAGFVRYRSSGLGEKFEGNLFTAQFNRHRVQRHVLKREGATFSATKEDFLVSSDFNFHPTDVLEDADGSLLVIDTGGWFSSGCPTSRGSRPQFKGSIYRVTRKGAPAVKDPRGTQIAWDRATVEELCQLTDDPRPIVRDWAVDALALKGEKSIDALKKVIEDGKSSVRVRRNAVWALARQESDAARAVIRLALKDGEESVRLAAINTLAVQRDKQAAETLRKLVVEDASPAVRRESATALGRVKDAAAVPVLFDALAKKPDRFLEHSLIYALIQIGDAKATLPGLKHESPTVRIAAARSLDQMDSGALHLDRIVTLLESRDPEIQKTVLELLTRRGGASDSVLGLLRESLTAEKYGDDRREALQNAVVVFSRDFAVQDLLVNRLGDDKASAETRVLLLEAMTRVPMETLPRAWSRALKKPLEDGDERVLLQALAVVRMKNVEEHDDAVLAVARDEKKSAAVRVAALSAVAPRLGAVDAALVQFLLGRLKPELPALDRLAAAQTLAALPLDVASLKALTEAVKTAGPLELPHLLTPYEKNTDADVGKKLAEALGNSSALTGLRAETVRATFKSYSAEVRETAEPLYKELSANTEQQEKKMGELEPLLKGGDAKRGHALFFGPKAACSACHSSRGLGGRTGPDLTTIGGIRHGRDLLESLVYPSNAQVRGYETYVLTTKAGKVMQGVLGRETADSLTLVQTDRTEVRVSRSEIESLERGSVSIMPQGLDAQLTQKELRDLLAYLQSLK